MALVSQEPVGLFTVTTLRHLAAQTLYAGTNILLGAIKPHSEVTQEEIEEACRNANVLGFINDLLESVPFLICCWCFTDHDQSL
jgi:ATP-binding cassette, subfamily B (MDR/TAP), member 1